MKRGQALISYYNLSVEELYPLVPNHRSAKEAQYLANRISHGNRGASRKQQTDGFRAGGNVLHHQRTRVAAAEELAPGVGNEDLTRKGLGEGRSAGAFILVRHADGRIQTADITASKTGRAAALLDRLVD